MAALLTNEFYEHLYRLEEQGTPFESWIDVVNDNDPDLIWCQNFTQKIFDVATTFPSKVHELYDRGYYSRRKIAREMGMTVDHFNELLQESDMTKEQEVQELVEYAVLVHTKKTDEWFIAKDVKKVQDYFNISHSAVHSSLSRKTICGTQKCMLYHLRERRLWVQEVFPEFNEEELLNANIIRMA